MLYELLSGDTLRGVCHRQLDALRRAYDIATVERVPVDVIVIRYSGTSHVVCRLRPETAPRTDNPLDFAALLHRQY